MHGHQRATSTLLALVAFLTVVAASSMPLKDIIGPIKNRDLQRDGINYRLSNDVSPDHYKIKIAPHFQDGKPETFTGEVEIRAIVNTAITKVTMHKADNIYINVDEVKVFEESSGVSLEISNSTTNETTDFYEIILKETVQRGKVIIIRITYKADFPEGMYGFYKSTYTFTSENGDKSEDVLLVTQFQPTHARKAFPCFDEPRFKATFEVVLQVPTGYKALSNTDATPNNVQLRETDQQEIIFEKTPKMSTYILAFIVYKEDTYKGTARTTGNLPFRTWARSQEIDAGTGELSQTDGPKIIQQMETYTGIRYTDYSKKIDQAAIPDFSFGAMENWGLVTYRETALLYDKSEHTQAAKKRVSELIAHELAHQWFGNLVTTEWWSTTWLNEGFATYFEYFITDKLHPLWRMMERIVIDEQLAAFNADASLSATPLTNDEINSPEAVAGHFGTITYSKGGSVVLMFSNILGEEKFRTALQKYLIQNAGDTATPKKLFDALTENADVGLPINANLGDIFESWTISQGFPVINVTREESQIVFTQEQFLADGSSTGNTYNVLLTLISNDESYTAKKQWILATQNKVTLDEVPEPGSWLLVPTTGYFRINYDEENWANLTEQLRNQDEELIEPIERAMLIDNALSLARSNKLKYSTALQLLSYLENEVDYIPWSVAFSGLNYIHRMLIEEGDTIERFLLQITNNVYEDLGFKIVNENNDEKHIEHIHRANVLNWACRAGHAECISNAVEHLRNYLEKNEKVNPDLRSVVYCYGVKHEEDLWTKLWKKLETTDDATERSLLISALGCSKVSSTLYLYLETAVLGGAVRFQDIASVFSSVYSNPDGVDAALLFLEFNLRNIEERTSTVMNGLTNIIRGIAQYMTKEEQVVRLQTIANSLTNPEHIGAAQAGVATAKVNLKWQEVHKDAVLSELEKIAPPPSLTTPSFSSTTLGAWSLRPAALALAVSVALPALAFVL